MEAQKYRRGAFSALGAIIRANVVAASIIAVGILVAGIFVFRGHLFASHGTVTSNSNPSLAAGAPKATKSPDISLVNQNGVPYVGRRDAPVVVAYWFDYQCPFCKKVESDILPQLIKDYVDTGKVKLLFKGYPTLGDDSRSAALAERGVWAAHPEKFLSWHQEMFARQDGENKGWGNRKDIVALMASLGMKGDDMDKLVVANAQQYQQALMADMKEAEDFGLTGTPAFIIGKKSFIGSSGYADIKAAIEKELNK